MPPIVIDAEFFPHIIDSIFLHAPAAALLALRVNSEWRDRAERQLAYHVCLSKRPSSEDPSSSDEGGYELRTGNRDIIGVWKLSDLRTQWAFMPSFLSLTAVVDLDLPHIDSDVSFILQHFRPRLSYRCHRSCDLAGFEEQNPRIIVFAQDMVDYNPMSYFADYRLNRTLGPKTLILHLRAPGMESYFDSLCLGNLRSLVLVFHKWRMPSIPVVYVREILLYKALGLFVDLLLLAWLHNVPTTVVNFDFTDLEKKCPDLGAMKDVVLEHLAYRKAGYVNTSDNQPEPRFLTLDEYRAEVGEAQFGIDMNEGAVMCPDDD